ncbi:SdpI family protein [Streptomyces sp. ODS28]|uniref:SdpI family protein n=1 Tax=Streptomyces sp. ODS28 TaxID=3136688 RepID=UPI0031E902DB
MFFAASVTSAPGGPDTLSRAVLAVVFGACGLLIGVIGRLGADGRLRRNRIAGIRTRRSLADEESWRTVHRAAAPWSYASGAALLLGGTGAVPARSGEVWVATVLGGTALSVALALVGTWSGHRALDRARDGERGGERGGR